MSGPSGRPRLTLVAEGLAAHGAKLYVGDQIAASDDALLGAHGITYVLNCAVNLDINYVDKSLDTGADGALRLFGHAPVRSAKVGLIDGAGNHPTLLLAACQVLDGMLQQELPEKASYPLRGKKGNVLVHCRGGRSRSVAVAALYLRHMHPDRFPDFDATVARIRELRQIEPEKMHKSPSPGLMETARQALAMIASGRGAFPYRAT